MSVIVALEYARLGPRPRRDCRLRSGALWQRAADEGRTRCGECGDADAGAERVRARGEAPAW